MGESSIQNSNRVNEYFKPRGFYSQSETEDLRMDVNEIPRIRMQRNSTPVNNKSTKTRPFTYGKNTSSIPKANSISRSSKLISRNQNNDYCDGFESEGVGNDLVDGSATKKRTTRQGTACGSQKVMSLESKTNEDQRASLKKVSTEANASRCRTGFSSDVWNDDDFDSDDDMFNTQSLETPSTKNKYPLTNTKQVPGGAKEPRYRVTTPWDLSDKERAASSSLFDWEEEDEDLQSTDLDINNQEMITFESNRQANKTNDRSCDHSGESSTQSSLFSAITSRNRSPEEFFQQQDEILKQLKEYNRLITERNNQPPERPEEQEVDEDEWENTRRRIPLQVRHEVRTAVKLSDKKWIVGNGMSWNSAENLPVNKFVIAEVNRILQPNPPKKQIIMAMKTYFRSLQQKHCRDNSPTYSTPVHNKNSKLRQRKYKKLGKRQKALAHWPDLDDTKKESIRNALHFDTMSSEESETEEYEDGGKRLEQGIFVVKNYNWRSKRFKWVLKQLDDITKGMSSSRARRLCFKRVQSDVMEKEPPDCIRKCSWAIAKEYIGN